MKIRSLGLCLILTSLLLGGCAFMNEEDRDFYGRGWIKPTDLDKTEPHHIYADPAQPSSAASSAPTRRPEPEWIVPETTDHPR